nr:anti-sigma F factor [Clostridia bacterium]
MFQNEMHLSFSGLSQNESFARMAVAAFATQLNPTIEELTDIRTAVSEAVTNAIVHGYESHGGTVYMDCYIKDRMFEVI